MSLDFGSWLSTSSDFAPSASDRAVAAWSRIQDKPTSITITRKDTDLSAQTVRVEYSTGGTEQKSEGGVGTSAERSVIIFGIKDHPTEDDTDIRRGDAFSVEVSTGQYVYYRVIDVVHTLGEVQARAVANV